MRGLCGVFGAFYVADRRSVMNGLLENVEPGPVRFGDVAHEIISLTRDFDFREGPGSLTPETVGKIKGGSTRGTGTPEAIRTTTR